MVSAVTTSMANDLDVQDYQPLLNDVLETLESRDIDISKLNIIEEKE